MKQPINLDKAKSLVFLTAALVMTVTWAVGASGWTKGMNVLTFVGLGVILIGLMLARSILPGFIAHLFSLIIGLGWTFWVVSRMLPPHYSWLERWENMVFRLQYWYTQALQGGTSYDNLMFLLQMGLILWGMGYLTLWFVFRSQKVWQAIVPGGLVLLINLYYAPHDLTPWFLLYLLLAMLLVIRFNLHHQEQEWRAKGVFFRPDIGFDFLLNGLIFLVLVLVMAWLAPPVVDARSLGVLDEFEGSWREFQQDWNRLYADLNYRDVRGVGTFGQSLTLGGPRNLTREPVMDVAPQGLGRYWRAAVYDQYNGQAWRSNDDQEAQFGPSRELALPSFLARTPVTQTYTLYRDNVTVLYALNHPVSLDRSAEVRFNALPGEQVSAVEAPTWPVTRMTGPWAEEITYMRSNAAVDNGESYQVVSMVSQASVEQLRAAGTDYPAWVTDRYLQLPSGITDRTRQLAQELAAPYDNPFDRVVAIEDFLRRELTYNEQLTAPPPGVDKVDYIIFTAKEAYCDYYATSMIVMLRSLGIPARMAAGYSRGRYNSEMGLFHVVNADAHSWVEVYFPRYGWIEFEPTATQPTIIRPRQGGNIPANSEYPNPTENLAGPEEQPDRPGNIPIDEENFGGGGQLYFSLPLPWVGPFQVTQAAINRGLLGIGLLALLALAAGGLWWWQFSRPTESIVALHRRMTRLAGWMGLAIRPWHTPYEHAALLQRSLPAHREDVATITEEYVFQTFGTNHLRGESGTRRSNLAWSRLWPAMLRAVFRRYRPRRFRR